MDLTTQLGRLNAEQLEIALKVIEEAERQQVNPELVLPIVAIESNFNHKSTSNRGAIGVMQLMPETAKELGVDPNNLDENISGGVKFIKQLSGRKNIGDDPYRLLVGYNAGPNSSYFKTGDAEDLPEETKNYLVKAHAYYGDDLPAPSSEDKQKEGEVVAETQYGPTKVEDAETSAEDEKGRRVEAGVLGGVAGAGIGAFKMPVVALARRVAKAFPKDTKISPEEMERLVDMAAKKGAPSDSMLAPYVGEDAGRMAEGKTGVMPYNYAKAAGLTDIEAMKALDMTKQEGGVHDLTTKRREAMQKIGQSFPSHGYVENPNYSGIMTPTVESRSPRESFAYGQEGARQIPKPIPISAEVRAKKVQRQPGAISKVAGAIAESSPVRMGLAGYGAMYNAQDAWQNRNNDPAGSMMSGAGALGDIASLAPLATKWGARLAPTGAALSSAADTARRLKQNDYIGAVTSGLGAIAPYAAPFVFGPQVGIPVGIATALGAPIANEIKDSQMMERVMEYLDGLRRNQGR